MMHEPIVDFAQDRLGFHPWPRQAEILDDLYRDAIRTGVLRCGRRGGKGRIAAVVATYEATVNADAHLGAVLPDEQVAIVVVSKSQKQARVVHRYVASFLRAMGAQIVRDTVDEIELKSGIVILTLPCHAASVRGLAVAVVILDEAAWWTGVDGSPLDPGEIWSAIVPATAQFPAGRVLVLSTPRWSSGWFSDLCAQASSGRFADMRTWHVSTADMNPAIPASFLAQEAEKDPANYRREYLAEFESGIGALFEEAIVRAAVRSGRPEVYGPLPGVAYTMTADPAFTGDTFAAMVGHREPSGRCVVDRIASWRGSKARAVQLDPTLDEIAEIARAYNDAAVLIDQYAAEPIQQGLRKRSVAVRQLPWTNDTKLSAATETRRVLTAGLLEIPDHAGLIGELLRLEQRPTPSGRPRIAAPGREHDDFATALMALVQSLAAPTTSGDFSLVA